MTAAPDFFFSFFCFVTPLCSTRGSWGVISEGPDWRRHHLQCSSPHEQPLRWGAGVRPTSSLPPVYIGVCPQWPHTPSCWSGAGSPGKLLNFSTMIYHEYSTRHCTYFLTPYMPRFANNVLAVRVGIREQRKLKRRSKPKPLQCLWWQSWRSSLFINRHHVGYVYLSWRTLIHRLWMLPHTYWSSIGCNSYQVLWQVHLPVQVVVHILPSEVDTYMWYIANK